MLHPIRNTEFPSKVFLDDETDNFTSMTQKARSLMCFVMTVIHS